MKCAICLFLWSVLPIANLFAANPGSASVAPAKTVVEWTFDQPGNLQGWQPNRALKEVTVANGVVSAQAVGSDPDLCPRGATRIPRNSLANGRGAAEDGPRRRVRVVLE